MINSRFETGHASDLTNALSDFKQGTTQWRIWLTLAIDDIRNRYMRSFLGTSWVFVSFGLFVAVKILIFSPLAPESDPLTFAAYVTIGFFVWTFVQAVLVEGCSAFVAAQHWIKGMRVPLSLFVWQNVARNSLLTAVNLLVVIVVLALCRIEIHTIALSLFPITLLFLWTAVWVTVLFAVISTRFRDFAHLVQTVMRILMFLSPIFWLPEQMGGLMKVLIFNPIAHYIILFRDPLLYGTMPWDSLYVVCGITIGGTLAALAAFAYARNRLVFWF